MTTPSADILGLRFDAIDLDGAAAAVADFVDAGRPAHVVTANVDYVYLCQRDAPLADIVRRADLVVADGVPILWMARWQHTPLPGRVNGTDLVMRLLADAGRRAWRVAFLGGPPGVAERAAAEAEQRWGVTMVGAWGPPPEVMDDPDQSALVAGRIRELGVQLLLIGIGGGRQDRWIERHRSELGPVVVIGVGSALDFVAGNQRRAPAWMQRRGLEWAWRLALEPRRLARRYLVDDPQVLIRFGLQRLGRSR